MIRVSNFEVEYSCRPRILLVKMGQDGHNRVLWFITSRISDLGFDVNIGPLFSTPWEMADMAADSNVHVIEVSSQAARHLSLLPALRNELSMKSRRRYGGVGRGIIPTRDHNFILEGRKMAANREGAVTLYSVPGIALPTPP